MASIAEGGVGFAGGGEEKWIPRNPLVVQWLGLCASAAGTGVQSLVQEPRSCKWQGAAKKKKGILKERFWGVACASLWHQQEALSFASLVS